MHRPLRLAILIASIYAGSAFAQAKSLDIPAQTMAGALTTLANQSGIQILFNADDLKGTPAPALKGNLSAQEALRQLLAGSGLTFTNSSAGTWVIKRTPAQQSTLPEVLVTASAEPGYKAEKATVASKLPLSPREIPNSVSVLTREQMNDQDMVTTPEALQQVTGMNVYANDTLTNQYLARGYSVGVMYDGVTSYNGMTPSYQFDLPLYERIEVLRGPAGLQRGVGEPGGVVNLVKKKPKEEFAASWSTSLGSWDTYRAEGDITGALNSDKSLLGRLVVANEDRGYFYDDAHSRKWLFMGALQYRLTPQTTFDLSFSAQRQNVKNPYFGIPFSSQTDANGAYMKLDVPRSTYYGADWNKAIYDSRETSASIEHRFENDWVAKANFNHRRLHAYAKEVYTGSTVNATTGRVTYWSDQWADDDTRDGLDIYAGGPFQLFGRKHNFLLGYNAERYNHVGLYGDGPTYSNVIWGDASALTEPAISYTDGSESDYRQYGLYSQLRLSLADPLTLVLGGRTTTFRAKTRDVAPSTQSQWAGGARADNRVTPYAGVLYDVTRNITLYASYADIFVPQTQKTSDGSVLSPRTGRQYEIGSKGEFMDGKLGASLAIFNIRDKNRAYRDPDYPTQQYYLNAGEVESKGAELEITGKPMRGLDMTAGYTYLTTSYIKDRNNQGKTYSIQTPNNQLKLWGNYRFAQDSALAGWSTGLGLLYMGDAQSTRGRRNVMVNDDYTVVNGRIAYQIDKNYSLSLLVTNLFDTKYYASVGQPHIYNFVGEPRSFMLTLRGSY
jgi:outer membrane receptor for ferric coprogen and ferric-rhodotorulic acid